MSCPSYCSLTSPILVFSSLSSPHPLFFSGVIRSYLPFFLKNNFFFLWTSIIIQLVFSVQCIPSLWQSTFSGTFEERLCGKYAFWILACLNMTLFTPRLDYGICIVFKLFDIAVLQKLEDSVVFSYPVLLKVEFQSDCDIFKKSLEVEGWSVWQFLFINSKVSELASIPTFYTLKFFVIEST